MVPAVQLVVTLDTKEHEVVPSVGNAWVVDVVWSKRYLMMHNPFLPLAVVPDEFIMTSFTDIEFRCCIRFCTCAPSL